MDQQLHQKETQEALARLENLDQAMQGYKSFCKTLARYQAHYNRYGSYVPVTYEQASADVYLNDKYMLSEYLPGTFISHWLWPHHYQQLKFFEQEFLGLMREKNDRVCFEVGVGSGAYSYHALKVMPSLAVRAIDISPAAIRFSSQINPTRYHAHIGTIEQQPDESEDWVVCVEILEHLEDPLAFLFELDRVLKYNGHAFVTAAVNAGSPDHIIEYRSPEQVENHLLDAGFRVIKKFYAEAAARPGRTAPGVAAFLVKKV